MKLKHRGISKGLIVLVNSLSQLGKMLNLDGLDPVVLGEHGSRPVTWLIPATRRAPLWLTGGRREMAVRVCSLPLVNALIDRVGPLISTSANPSGRPAPRSLLQARGYFRAGVDYFLPGKLGRAGGPSEIRDARSGRILRKGR
jgi:L-threonylcarbamoyladenylate synthase